MSCFSLGESLGWRSHCCPELNCILQGQLLLKGSGNLVFQVLFLVLPPEHGRIMRQTPVIPLPIFRDVPSVTVI